MRSLILAGAALLGCIAHGAFAIAANETVTLSGVASFTYYVSYAACCPNNPNYDPRADKTECQDYSACEYPGEFYCTSTKSFDYVKSHNIVSFYDNSDPYGKYFSSRYCGKTVRLSKNGITFDAAILDTCGNSDCGNCCAKNSQPSGFLIDMEYWTVIRNFGSVSKADGQISFTIL